MPVEHDGEPGLSRARLTGPNPPARAAREGWHACGVRSGASMARIGRARPPRGDDGR
jgi:hypothetical protein